MDFASLMGALIRAPIPTDHPERDRALLLVLAALAERPGEAVVCSPTALAQRAGVGEPRTVYRALARLGEAGLLVADGRGVAIDLDAVAALGRAPSWRGRLPDGDLAQYLNSTRHHADPTRHHAGSEADGEPGTIPGPTRHHADLDPAPYRVQPGTVPGALYMSLSDPSIGHLSDPPPEPSAQGSGRGEIGKAEQQGAPGGLEKIARGVATSPPWPSDRAELEAVIMASLFPSRSTSPLPDTIRAALTGALGVGGMDEQESIRAAREEWPSCVASPHPLLTLRSRMVTRARQTGVEATDNPGVYPRQGRDVPEAQKGAEEVKR